MMKTIFWASAFCGAASVVSAASVNPVSYATSGVGATAGGGSYYMDDAYSGTASSGVPRAYSGGLGDLTDGVIATESYNFYEGYPSPGPVGSPYVGWANINPVITFTFGAVTQFDTATFYFDDRGGAAGVGQPAGITINSVSRSVPTNATAKPFSFVFDMTGVAPTDTLTVTLTRGASWTFLSEVQFTDGVAAAVPLPATGVLLLAGLGGLAAMRRRKTR